MDNARRALGLLLIVFAAAIAIQVIVNSVWDESGYAGDIWQYLNWVIAMGIVLVFEQEVRRAMSAHVHGRGDTYERLSSTFMLMLSTALLLLFFEQWFTVRLFPPDWFELTEARSANWIAINVLFVAVTSAVGYRLMREAMHAKRTATS